MAENLTTTDDAAAAVNRPQPKGTYRVIAEHGVQISKLGDFKKGDKVYLEGGVVDALIHDGSIEPVAD